MVLSPDYQFDDQDIDRRWGTLYPILAANVFL
jgi:hypothetical protein